MTDSYPNSLKYVLNKLSGFSRNRVKTILPYGTISPGQTIVMRLPTNALVDLSTFTLQWDITTTATASYSVPPSAGMMLEFVDVSVGGQSVQTISQHSQLYKALFNHTAGDQCFSKSFYENNGMCFTVPGANTLYSSVTMAHSQWLGLLGSGKILNTAMLPEIVISVRFVPNVAIASGATDRAYTLTNTAISYDVCTLDNPVYFEVLQRQLQGDGVKLPYTNYLGIQGSQSTLPVQAQFSVATQSLDYLIGTIQPSGYLTSNSVNVNTGVSAHFNHGFVPSSTDSISAAQYQVGAALIPAYKPTLQEQLVYTQQSMGLNLDTTGRSVDGFRPNSAALSVTSQTNTTQYSKFVEGNYLFVARLCSGDKGTMSGLNTQGSNAVMTFRVEGTSTGQYIPLVFMQFTSVLNIGPNRQISVVL